MRWVLCSVRFVLKCVFPTFPPDVPSPVRSVRSGSVIAWGVRAGTSVSDSSGRSDTSVRWRKGSVYDKSTGLTVPKQRTPPGGGSPTGSQRRNSFLEEYPKGLIWQPGTAIASNSQVDSIVLTSSDHLTPPRTPSPVSEHSNPSSSPYFSATASASSPHIITPTSARFVSLGATFPSPSQSGHRSPKLSPRLDTERFSRRTVQRGMAGSQSMTSLSEKRKGRILEYGMEHGELPQALMEEDNSNVLQAINRVNEFGSLLYRLPVAEAPPLPKSIPNSPNPDRRHSVGPSAPALFSLGEGYAGGKQRDEKGKKINVAKWQSMDPLNKGGASSAEKPTGLKGLKKRFSSSLADLFSSVAPATEKPEEVVVDPSTTPSFFRRTASGLFGIEAAKRGSTPELSIPWEETPSPKSGPSISRVSLKLLAEELPSVPQRLSSRRNSLALRRESKQDLGPPPSRSSPNLLLYTSTPDFNRHLDQSDVGPTSPNVCPRVLQWVSNTQGVGARPEMTTIEPIPQGVDLGFRASVVPEYIAPEPRFPTVMAKVAEDEDNE